MRLTQYTDFSLRVMIYLALNPDRRSTIQEIAEAYSVSRNHLMKVVQQLSHAGYVDTARGNQGGLQLSRPAAEINIGELVAEMEPDFGMVECLRPDNRCVITGVCALPGLLGRATEAYLDVLGTATLEDLLPPALRPQLRATLGIDSGVSLPERG